ncbi:MAG TPA: small acid-soluble spore protein Tlp [Desulfosporosinus sp.]|nr:small acid-soluble spore protein Tlp [Desulfosporosinus sp.]
MTKKDNPSEYKANLKENIDHTVANLHEAEDYLYEQSSEITSDKKQIIEAKNARREESIKDSIAAKKDQSHQ